MTLYQEKFQQLQKEFKKIKLSSNWKFEEHHQAMYDFVMHTKSSTTFTVNDYTITVKVGNERFGFKHLILRHYGDGCIGRVTALDILKIGNVIKRGINISSKCNNKITFIQNKNNPNDLLLSFFSSK